MPEIKKILIVDDSMYFRTLKQSYLARKTCQILQAKNGEDALHVMVEEKPDLVIMDFSMPLVNGEECLRVIKNHPDYEKTPVIMMANAWDKDAKKRCTDAGCDDFIQKPINRQRLYSSIKSFLNIAERGKPRVSYEAMASVRNGENDYRGMTTDISTTGVFVRCNDLYNVDTAVELSFDLKGVEGRVHLSGTVVRIVVSEDVSTGLLPGMGIKFFSIPEDLEKVIKRMIL